MADDHDGPLKPEFDRAKVVAAFEKLLPRLGCRLCGSQSWEPVFEPDADIYSGITFYRGPAGAPFGYAAAIPVVCGVCGLTELFDPVRLARWDGKRRDG
jgi:hypothetical protein